MRAELEMAEKKIKMKKAAKAASAKLPELKITPFKGTPVDWIRFQNMLTSQIHDKPLSDEEKYGYLLELVAPKVRSRLANLKPGALGYKTAWDRLKTEFGQSKTVVATHMEEIINLPVTRGSNYERVCEFYEKLSKNFYALQTLGEGEMLKGFVLSTLNKLPQVKPDLVRTDEGWEDWNMEKLIDSIQKWLKCNKTEDNYKDRTDTKRKNAITLTRRTPTACSATKTAGEIRAQHTTKSRNGGNSLYQNSYVTIAPAQGTLGKNVVAGDTIGARANTTPACVISLRGTRRRIPMPL